VNLHAQARGFLRKRVKNSGPEDAILGWPQRELPRLE